MKLRLSPLFAVLLFLAHISDPAQSWPQQLTSTTSISCQHCSLEHLNVLLIVIDTLGANQLPAFGGKDTVTPNISKLASRSVVFTRAYSAAPWTKPAIASIFTGQLPSTHKVRRIRDKMDPEVPVLAERLKSMGFSTAGYVSHTLVSPKTGYARGFQNYEIVKFRGHVHNSVTSDQVSDSAIKQLDAWRGAETAKNFFLFLHYFDPHYNYIAHLDFDRSSWYAKLSPPGPLSSGMSFKEFRKLAPKMSLQDRKFMEDLHQEEISFTDRHVGRLLDYLDQHKLADNTLVILTADHGEEFFEHGGIGHGRSLYDEVIRVPLMISFPKRFKPRVVNDPVSTLDILQTIMSLASKPPDLSALQGQSLLPLLEGASAQTARKLVMEVDYSASLLGAVEGPLKIILDKHKEKWELYDLSADPAEKTNQFDKINEKGREIEVFLQAYRSANQHDLAKSEFDPEEESKGMDSESIEQLKSLGYL